MAALRRTQRIGTFRLEFPEPAPTTPWGIVERGANVRMYVVPDFGSTPAFVCRFLRFPALVVDLTLGGTTKMLTTSDSYLSCPDCSIGSAFQSDDTIVVPLAHRARASCAIVPASPDASAFNERASASVVAARTGAPEQAWAHMIGPLCRCVAALYRMQTVLVVVPPIVTPMVAMLVASSTGFFVPSERDQSDCAAFVRGLRDPLLTYDCSAGERRGFPPHLWLPKRVSRYMGHATQAIRTELGRMRVSYTPDDRFRASDEPDDIPEE
jgi:hypothetical protein